MDETQTDQSEKKWTCMYCTYENCQKNQKCVMCLNKKDPLHQDIFRLKTYSDLLEREDESIECGSSQQNHERVNSDIQIQQTEHSVHDRCGFDENLLKNNFECMALDDKHYSETKSIQNKSNDEFNTKALSASTDRDKLVCDTLKKWTCLSCTYENWPKSSKCTMCNQTKDQQPTSSASSLKGAISKKYPNNNLYIGHNLVRPLSPNKSKMDDNNQKSLSKRHNNKARTFQDLNLAEVDSKQARKWKMDQLWLNACLGVVDNQFSPVQEFLAYGGNPTRALTPSECIALNRNSAFDTGHTLIHLAVRFHREEMLPCLLSRISSTPNKSYIKRVPSYVAVDVASDIRRNFAQNLRIRKNPNAYYVTDFYTFALPIEIEELPISIQEQLYDELLDKDAQQQLESTPPAINWSNEVAVNLLSRLYVLWNRSAGDCLLDSALQATYGIFDRENDLRRALSDTLNQCSNVFYTRWKEYEMFQASLLNFTLEETQWQDDWNSLISSASQPGTALEQLHIFALAHILRRPIIVYGVKAVKSFRGEDLGYAKFEGLYLPLLWDNSFCTRSPIALGYTRGHFSALVAMENCPNRFKASHSLNDPEAIIFLPLVDSEMKLLPIHFLNQDEMGNEEHLMRQWLDVCYTEGQILVARQRLTKRPLLVAQMLEEWLNYYRQLAQVYQGPFTSSGKTGYLSDGGSDEE